MAIISLLISLGLVVIDQIIKIIVDKNMDLYQTISVIKINGKEIFNLTYVLNDGAGWSIFKGKTLFLVLITSVFLIGIIIYMVKFAEKKPLLFASLSLIVAGGLGNLVDRIFRHGKVIDFIEARFIDFPVFNFADICVTFGVIILFIYLIKSEIVAKKKKEIIKSESESSDDK